jgi:hypothetical protein
MVLSPGETMDEDCGAGFHGSSGFAFAEGALLLPSRCGASMNGILTFFEVFVKAQQEFAFP